jgi:hypothetical protein
MAPSGFSDGQDHEKQATFCPQAGTFPVKGSILDPEAGAFPVERPELAPGPTVKPVSRPIRDTFYAVCVVKRLFPSSRLFVKPVKAPFRESKTP